jgi:hypothetical protein
MTATKLLLLITMFSITSMTFGQIKGVDFKSALPYGSLDYGKLRKGSNANSYIIIFEQTPVGLKKCIDKAEEILIANDKSLDKATVNRSLLYSTVKNIHDYQNLFSTLTIGYSAIEMYWLSDDTGSIAVRCDDKLYGIMIQI